MQLVEKHLAKTTVAVVAVLAIAQVWSIRSTLRVPDRQSPPATGNVAPRSLQLGAIIAGHLFGQPEFPVAAAVEAVSMKLSGVLAADDPAQGLAIISEEGKEAHVYAVGGRLPGGATLKGVYPQSAIIDLGGEQQVLRLPRGSAASGLLATLGLETGGGSLADFDAQTDGPSARELSQRFELMHLDDTPVMSTLNPDPQVVDGKLVGYQLSVVSTLGVGLQTGDLLKKVNGIDMTDPTAANAAFASIPRLGSVELTVLRAGKLVMIQVDSDRITH